MTTPTYLNQHTPRANGISTLRPSRLLLLCQKIRITQLLFLISIVFLNGGLQAQSSGIVIFRNNTAVPESSSKVMEYTAIRKDGAVTQYFTASGQSVRLTKFQPQFTVTYPNLLARSITGPEQLGSIEQGLASYKEIVKKYPNAAPFLNPYIQRAEEIQRRIRGGSVLFNGTFMTKGAYEDLIRREEKISTEFLEESRDKKRLEEEQAMRLDIENRRRKQ